MNKNFFLLWQGQSVSALGSHVFSIALVLWIKHVTGSASLLGLLGMVTGIPSILLGSIGGTVADRYSRRRIIILCDLLKGFAIISLAVFFFFTPASKEKILIALFAVSMFSATISAFFQPAIAASIPEIVPPDKINQANSLGQLTSQLSMFFGQSLGGVLFKLLGMPLLVLFNGITFIFSAISELFIDIPQTIPEKKGGLREQFVAFKKDFLEGFHYVWNARGLKKLVFGSVFLTFFTVPIILLLPFYVENYLGLEDYWYGFILSAHGFGSLIGYFSAGFLNVKGKNRAFVISIFMILDSLTYGLLVVASNAWMAAGISIAAGIFSGFISVNVLSILQLTTPSEIRGRVFGFLITFSASLSPLGMGLAGFVADLTGQNIPLIYLASSGVMALISLLVAMSGDIREFLSFDQEVVVKPKLTERDLLFQRSREFKRLGNYVEVFQLLNKALMQNRRDQTVLYELALLNYEMEKYEDALWYLNQLFEFSPRNVKALILTASIYKKLNKLDTAKRFLNRILEISPGHKVALINLGVIYYLQKQYHKSIQLFEKVVALYPRETAGYLGLANNYASLQQPEIMTHYLDKALSVDPDGKNGEELLNSDLFCEKIESEE